MSDNKDIPFMDEGPSPSQENAKPDMLNKPPHYRSHPSGVECIQITEHMNFCLGNAMKYIWRAGEKGSKIEDLEKAAWYINREIARLKAQQLSSPKKFMTEPDFKKPEQLRSNDEPSVVHHMTDEQIKEFIHEKAREVAAEPDPALANEGGVTETCTLNMTPEQVDKLRTHGCFSEIIPKE